jgi:hypothetical protein
MVARIHLVDAYRLMRRRTGQALLTGLPDGPSPLRRINVGLACGVVVGAVALAGTAIAARLSPSAQLDRPGTLVIEQETGARYVSCGPHRLCPALNYTSARLAAGPHVALRTASRRTLAGFGRGPSLGIQGAPDTLPDARHLVGSPWAACVSGTSAITLVLGRAAGHPLEGMDTVPVVADGHPWIIQGGLRHPITGPAPSHPVLVPGSWLAVLPIGPNLPAPAGSPPKGPLCLSSYGVSTGGTLRPGGPLILPSGGTALVDGQTNGQHAYALLTDGRRYELASPQVLRLLGYTAAQAVVIPPALLTAIPTGPELAPIPLP